MIAGIQRGCWQNNVVCRIQARKHRLPTELNHDYFLQRLRGQGKLHDGQGPEEHVCISIGVYFEPRDAH